MSAPGRQGAALLVAAALLAGCGTEAAVDRADPSATHTLPPEQERVPITDRAVAAIAFAHLSEKTSSREGVYTDRQDPRGIRWTDLRYRAQPGDDGDLVRVAVFPATPRYERCTPRNSHCVELPTDVPGATIYLHWSTATEEDPGSLYAALQRSGETSYVLQSAKITGDPREMDLAVSVDDMVDVLEDPWLTMHTSPEAVAQGAALTDWTPRPSYSQ